LTQPIYEGEGAAAYDIIEGILHKAAEEAHPEAAGEMLHKEKENALPWR